MGVVARYRERARTACAGSTSACRRTDADDPAGLRLADELSRETRASMVSISASAHALDALYGSVKPLIPPLRSTPPSRHSAILETLKAGFEIRGRAGGGGWAQEFKWLFELRDSAVHHEEKARPTEPHPAGTHTGYENVAYSLENAERALNFAFEVFETCVDRPRQNLPDVVAWAQRMKDSVTAAKGRRQPKPT